MSYETEISRNSNDSSSRGDDPNGPETHCSMVGPTEEILSQVP